MDEIPAGKKFSSLILFPNAVLCNSHVFRRKYSYLNNTSGVDILCTKIWRFPSTSYESPGNEVGGALYESQRVNYLKTCKLVCVLIYKMMIMYRIGIRSTTDLCNYPRHTLRVPIFTSMKIFS
jgi:hypothetical protein